VNRFLRTDPRLVAERKRRRKRKEAVYTAAGAGKRRIRYNRITEASG
jgi:hypothetical protein